MFARFHARTILRLITLRYTSGNVRAAGTTQGTIDGVRMQLALRYLQRASKPAVTIHQTLPIAA